MKVTIAMPSIYTIYEEDALRRIDRLWNCFAALSKRKRYNLMLVDDVCVTIQPRMKVTPEDGNRGSIALPNSEVSLLITARFPNRMHVISHFPYNIDEFTDEELVEHAIRTIENWERTLD